MKTTTVTPVTDEELADLRQAHAGDDPYDWIARLLVTLDKREVDARHAALKEVERTLSYPPIEHPWEALQRVQSMYDLPPRASPHHQVREAPR